MSYTEEQLVEAIRNHPLIGRGSCTHIDECFDRDELWSSFGIPAGNMTLEAAIADALDFEGLKMEKALDARWGEDDDPQLLAYKEWEAEKAEFEAQLAATKRGQ